MRKTQGLGDENGTAYEFFNVEKLLKPQKFVDQISTQLKMSNTLMVVANVRVLPSSYGTLFAVENIHNGR